MAFTVAVSSTRAVITGVAAMRMPRGTPLERHRWAGTAARLGRMDRFSALALMAVDEALLDAQLVPGADPSWDGERTSVVVGSAYGCHLVNEEYYRGFLEHGPKGASPRAFALTLPSSPLGEMTIHYALHGPGSTVVSGLTAAVEALGVGLADLRAGRATRVLVVAVDVATPLLERLTGLAPDDVAAAVVLELADMAAQRGASPRASLVSVASAYGPNAQAAMRSAADQALLSGARVAVESLIAAEPIDGMPAPSWVAHGLGAAPLLALIEALSRSIGTTASTLVVASDPAGAGAAALLE